MITVADINVRKFQHCQVDLTGDERLRPDFMWGFATAAAQIEGGGKEQEIASGRGRSIWDMFCDMEGTIADGSKVYDTCDHLTRYKEDIAIMKSYGANTYRFSISWPRIIPDGGRGDSINEKGLAFYSSVIDECLKHGITPFVTLHHWDLPEALYHRYGGWLDRNEVIPDFLRFAQVCFETFGDRVKHWLTFNEPWVIAGKGHDIGCFAPGHKSDTEPFIVAHNLILSHAYTVKLYKEKYFPSQKGIIGITLSGDWLIPYHDKAENIQAAQDRMDAVVGWFADPIFLGDYPASMKSRLGSRLPVFSDEEKLLVKGSSEIYGMNLYTTTIIKASNQGCETEAKTESGFVFPDGSILGTDSALEWLRDVPWGLRAMLNYVQQRYGVPIYITENGFSVKGESDLPVDQAINDTDRVKYFQGYLTSVLKAAIHDGVDVRSYMAWSFLDNFEWDTGLVPRFGAVHVDYKTKQRTPKASAGFLREWFARHIQK